MRLPLQFLIEGCVGIAFAAVALVADRVLFARLHRAKTAKLLIEDGKPFRSSSRRPVFLSRASNQG